MFRDFEFETAPEKWYSSLLESSVKDLTPLSLKERYQTILALYSVWRIANKTYDSILFSAVYEAGLSRGLVNRREFENLVNITESWQGFGDNKNSLEVLPQFVDHERIIGRTVGLKFGHYRRLTLPQIFELIIANSLSDSLILIIESGERTFQNKTDKLELTDQQRMRIIGGSSLVNFVGMTSGTDYSNAYYRSLVQTIKPDILYASARWNSETIAEYQSRADSVGAELQILPLCSDYSTTEMEKHIFE